MQIGYHHLSKWIYMLFCVIGLPLFVYGQSSTLTGTVLDEENEPLMGATVVVVGAKNLGAVTDIDGKFAIQGVPEASTLRVSYVGMNTLEVKLTPSQTTIKIILKADSELLEEVVVTGYGGRQVRAKVTNSIAKVDEKALQVGVYSNPGQALAGSVPGLAVTTNSGNPSSTPSIVLRGGTNLDGSGSPLVLVDGQLRGGLQDINPEDIASIDILKDAGATALYGARASNGVILITTKSGKQGTRAINVKAKVGFNWINPIYDFLGARDYITMMRRAFNESEHAPKNWLTSANALGTGNVLGPGMQYNIMGKTAENAYLVTEHGWQEMPDPIDSSKTIIFKETRARDYNIVNPALTQDYNVNLSGGNDKGSYYSGIGYNDSKGLPISSFYKRLNVLFNGSYKVADFLTSNSSVSFIRANWMNMPPSQTNESEYFGRVLSLPPTVRFVDEDGNPVLGPSMRDGNQLYQPEKFIRDNQSEKFTLIQSLDIQFMPELTLKLSGNLYYDEQYLENFDKDYQETPTKLVQSRWSQAQFDRTVSQTYNAVLNYRKTFADSHNLDLMLGSEYYDTYSRGMAASGTGAPTEDFMDLALTDNGEGKRGIDSYHQRSRIMSFFGRINYDYADKYLLSIVSRYDGYSSLLGENRWGFFPGVSGGWIFTHEDFVKESMPWLTFGKLRASYGINGNASGIGPYELQGSYNSTKYGSKVGFLIGTLPNPALRWEATRTLELGLDLGFFSNRLTTGITLYDRLTSDKYAQLALPPTTGFSSVRSNNGEFRNRGLEFEAKGTILDVAGFRWDMSANIAYNINTIISLPDNGLPLNRQNGQEIYTGNVNPDGTSERRWVGGYQEGQEPGVMVGFVANGIFQSDEEIPENYIDEYGNSNGKKLYSPKAYEKLTDQEKGNAIRLQAGDVHWKDINGDGKIDIYDQEVLGNTTPRWTGGANTTLSYKGLSLYLRVNYALGFTRYDSTTPWFMGAEQGSYNTIRESMTDTWTPENRDAKYPRWGWANLLWTRDYGRTSTLFASPGDYISLKEISLSYSLPQSWCKAIAAQNVSFSVTGQNLGFLTQGKVANPEVSWSGSGYGLPRTLLFGFGITF